MLAFFQSSGIWPVLIDFIKISEKGVEKELNRLNPCKATGPDKVPVRILKETANIVIVFFMV
jgi:hypothetical protein